MCAFVVRFSGVPTLTSLSKQMGAWSDHGHAVYAQIPIKLDYSLSDYDAMYNHQYTADFSTQIWGKKGVAIDPACI